MARYYYDVYELKSYSYEYNLRNFRNSHLVGVNSGRFANIHGYSDFGYTSESGYYGIGSASLGEDGACYRIYSSYELTLFVLTGTEGSDYLADVYHYRLDYDYDIGYEYYRGDYIKTIIAEDGTYPNNGHDYDYWYVKGDRAFPRVQSKINGELVDIVAAQVKIEGELRDIVRIEVKKDGELVEL